MHFRMPEKAGRAIYLLACVFVFVLPAKADEWYESYAKGLDSFRDQQWQQAINQFTEAINEKSDSRANAKTYGLHFIDYFPYVYRGVAYFKIGDKARALADLERAEREHVVGNARDDADAQQLLREYLDLARKSNAPQPDPNYADGLKLYNQKNYRDAIEKFKAVPESSPQRKDAVRYLGMAQEEQQRLDAEVTQKEKKERINRAFAAGVQLFNQKNLDKAEEQFKAVLQLDNTRADARDYLEKIDNLRNATRLAANESRTTEANAKKKPPLTTPTTRPEVKEPVRGPAVERTATETPAQGLLREGIALFQTGKIRQARAKFVELKGLDPNSTEVERYLRDISALREKARRGIAAFFEGDYNRAIATLKESSSNGTDDPHTLAFLACSYAAQFLLGGAEDNDLRQHAVQVFSMAKAVDANYALDAKYISPQIVALLGQR